MTGASATAEVDEGQSHPTGGNHQIRTGVQGGVFCAR